MFSSKNLYSALSLLFLVTLQPIVNGQARPAGLLASRPAGNTGVIEALLRSSSVTTRNDERGVASRQSGGSCATGFISCNDASEGCCAVSDYCTNVGGVPGCCPTGQTCTSNSSSSSCVDAGYQPCTGETFCCPTGALCSRDASGQPTCDNSSSSSSGSNSGSSTSSGSSNANPNSSGSNTSPNSSGSNNDPSGLNSNGNERSIAVEVSSVFMLAVGVVFGVSW